MIKGKKKQKPYRVISSPLSVHHVAHLGRDDLSEEQVISAVAEADRNLQEKICSRQPSSNLEQLLRRIIREELANILAVKNLERFEDGRFLSQSSFISEKTKNLQEEDNVENLTDEIRTTHGLGSDNRSQNAQHWDRSTQITPILRAERESSITELKQAAVSKGVTLTKEDERECLSKALQANISPLVDRLHFNLSHIPEELISSGQITEDECRMIRDDLSRKDQIRYLISRTKGRDLKDLEQFLKIVEKEVPDIVKNIQKQFEENKRNGVKCTTCALCQCTGNIDIKDVIDQLWAIGVVPDGLYNEAVACTRPRGSQDKLWDALIETCNSQPDSKAAYGKLFEAILQRGKFEFIVSPLKNLLASQGILQCNCWCNIKLTGYDTDTISYTSYTPTSSRRSSRVSIAESDVSRVTVVPTVSLPALPSAANTVITNSRTEKQPKRMQQRTLILQRLKKLFPTIQAEQECIELDVLQHHGSQGDSSH